MKLLFTAFLLIILTLRFSSAQCPYVHTMMINACTNVEGINELLVINSGAGFNLGSFEICFPNGCRYCNSGCGAQTWVTSGGGYTTYVSNLRALVPAACQSKIQLTVPAAIPANSTVVVFTGNVPTVVYDLDNLCSSPGDIYIILANNTNTAGRFSNNPPAGTGHSTGNCCNSPFPTGCGCRTLHAEFGGGCDGQTITYFTDDHAPPSGGIDGDYVAVPPSCANTDCSTLGAAQPLRAPANFCTTNEFPPQFNPFPIALLYFNAKYINENIEVNWATASEQNNKGFYLYSGCKPEAMVPVAFINGKGNSSSEVNYTYTLSDLGYATYYFQLVQEDFDGTSTGSEIIQLVVPVSKFPIKVYPTVFGAGELKLVSAHDMSYTPVSIALFNMNGDILFQQTNLPGALDNELDMLSSRLASGNYVLYITTGEQQRTVKLFKK